MLSYCVLVYLSWSLDSTTENQSVVLSFACGPGNMIFATCASLAFSCIVSVGSLIATRRVTDFVTKMFTNGLYDRNLEPPLLLPRSTCSARLRRFRFAFEISPKPLRT